MYYYLIREIKKILESIDNIKEVYMYPLPGNPKKYPAVICFQDSGDNKIESVKDNFKTFNFKLWVLVSLSGTDENQSFTNILPKTVDAIIEKFDAEWNGGQIDGHRIWQVVNSSQLGLEVNQKGKTAFWELSLTIKMTTSI